MDKLYLIERILKGGHNQFRDNTKIKLFTFISHELLTDLSNAQLRSLVSEIKSELTERNKGQQND